MSEQQYPGNMEIPQETRNRVIATFTQTLKLYTEGKIEDVVVGCDFILKLDPLFQPAIDLMTRAQNPEAPVDVEGYLRQYLEEGEAAEDAASTEDRLIEAIETFNQGDYSAALSIAAAILQADPNNAEAKDIARRAQEATEKHTFVQQFIDKATELLDGGDPEGALNFVKSGLELDPDNAELAGLQIRVLDRMQEQPSTAPAPEETPATVEEVPVSLELDTGATQPVTLDTAAPVVESPPEPTAAPTSFQFDSPAEESGGGADEPTETPFAFDTEPESAAQEEAPSAAGGDETSESFGPALSFETTEDAGDERVQNLLDEGDAAFHDGKYQEAIDIWSRIFLIDMNSDLANDRIEKAREAMSEAEGKVEEIYNLAVSLFDGGDMEEARAKFQEVLLVQPEHLQARSYIQKIEQALAPPAAAESVSVPAEEPESLFTPDQMPPPTSMPVEPEPAKKKKTPLLLAVIVAGILIVAAAVTVPKFLSGRGGNQQEKPPSADILIEHAQQFYELGKIDEALKKLNQVQPSDPLYRRALELIDEYRKSPQTPPEQNPANQESFDQMVQEARKAMRENRLNKAAELLTQAKGIQALSPNDAALLEKASEFANGYRMAESAFKEGHYEEAISFLDPLMERYLNQPEAAQLKADCHFNLGITFLKEKDMINAEKSFQAAFELIPNDKMAEKNMKLARKYQEYPIDLLYRIYVKYSSYR